MCLTFGCRNSPKTPEDSIFSIFSSSLHHLHLLTLTKAFSELGVPLSNEKTSGPRHLLQVLRHHPRPEVLDSWAAGQTRPLNHFIWPVIWYQVIVKSGPATSLLLWVNHRLIDNWQASAVFCWEVNMLLLKAKRKVDGDHRVFQEKWVMDYFFVDFRGNATCKEKTAVMKEYNVKRKLFN